MICMQFTAASEAIKRIDNLKPGWLVESCPQIAWKGAMGFRDVIFPGSYRRCILMLSLRAKQLIIICMTTNPHPNQFITAIINC